LQEAGRGRVVITKEEMKKLEPFDCPFCGNTDIRIENNANYNWAVCGNCETEGPIGIDRSEAIFQWNYRSGTKRELKDETKLETGE